MNTIEHFKNHEKNYARADKFENLTSLQQAKDIKLYVDGHEIHGLTGQVKLYFPQEDKHQATHIFCMSHLSLDPHQVEDCPIFDEKIKDFGEALALIKNPAEFLNRLDKKLDALKEEKIIYSISYAPVTYIDEDTYGGEMNVFKKLKKYSYQKEFRIALGVSGNIEHPFEIYLGDLSDIVQIVDIQKFNNKIQIHGESTVIDICD